ncbi:MAG: PilZ domain-containing protein [Thalassobaculaceae bacterium]|nr:PilZ domain-containing protein [Thalassobaculaceae bacterium]
MRQGNEQRRDKRAAKSGLKVEINRQCYPVMNFSAGGLLIGEAGFGFVTGRKVFLTLFHESRPSDKAFLYGHVIWLDIFRKVVGIDFVTPSEHSFQYLEAMLTATSRRPKPKPKKKSLLGRLFG